MAERKVRRSKKKLPARKERELADLARRIDQAEREAILARGKAVKRHHDRLRAVFEQLKAERARQGLSLADVARASGIDKARLSRLENASRPNVTIETIERYATALGKEVRIELIDRAA